MDHLYLPPSLRHFEPLRPARAAAGGEMALVYDLVEALRPGLCVDVGAGEAIEFCAMCQSARDHDVDCLLYAVDAWGEGAAEETPEGAHFTALNNFLHGHFRGSSYLMRMPAIQARKHFPDASVDLLRMDPARLGVSLGDALDAWMPSVAPGGVLVVRGAGGSDDSRAEWGRRSEAGFVLPGGASPGVCRIPGGGGADHELLRLMASESEEDRSELGRFYAYAEAHHALRTEIGDEGVALFRKKAG